MNGVLGFGNEHVANFQYGTNPDDGSSYINGLQYKDGSSVLLLNRWMVVWQTAHTPMLRATRPVCQLVHDNAVSYNNAQAAAGVTGFNEFDTSKSVGKVGDGSGSSGTMWWPTPPGGTSGGVGVGVNGATRAAATTAPGSTTTPGASAAATVELLLAQLEELFLCTWRSAWYSIPGASGTGAAAYSPEGTAPPVNGAALKGLLTIPTLLASRLGLTTRVWSNGREAKPIPVHPIPAISSITTIQDHKKPDFWPGPAGQAGPGFFISRKGR